MRRQQRSTRTDTLSPSPKPVRPERAPLVSSGRGAEGGRLLAEHQRLPARRENIEAAIVLLRGADPNVAGDLLHQRIALVEQIVRWLPAVPRLRIDDLIVEPGQCLRIAVDHRNCRAQRLIDAARHAIELCLHRADTRRSEEHTSELQSLMRISYAVFCLKKKK